MSSGPESSTLSITLDEEIEPLPPSRRSVVEPLWADPAFLPQIQANPRFRSFLDGADPHAGLARGEPGSTTLRAVGRLLAGAPLAGPDDLDRALDAAVSPEGAFTPPILLVEGSLHLGFDPVAWLEVAVTIATPRAATDASLRKAIGAAAELLALPSRKGLGAIAGGVVAQVREAIGATRGSTEEAFDSLVAQALLEERCYERRVVFGERRLRGVLGFDGHPLHLRAYLPESLATELPMFERFRVRALVEAHLPQDEGDLPAGAALRVLALGRVGTLRARG